MDVKFWLDVTASTMGILDEVLGDTCPECGKSSVWKQENKGKTWFTGKQKIKCGHCGKIFKVKL